MHVPLCLCALWPRIAARTRLVLVPHFKEWRRSSNTGRVAVMTLRHAELALWGRRSAALGPALGGREEWEHFVDLGAVFLGFGVFLANSAFRFQEREEGAMIGWGFTRRGALSELDVSYALALFASLLDQPDHDVTRHLRPNPKGFFRAARKHIRKKRGDELERLLVIRPTADGPYR